METLGVFSSGYLAALKASENPMAEISQRAQSSRTILIVDDDADVLGCVVNVLVELEYHILTAGNGAEALKRSRAYEDEIHLLLSDFQMPGMSGVELATAMTAERPKIKVLLMSGFTAGMLVLNEGWHFLAKPFVASQLRALVTGMVSPDKPTRFAG